MNDVLPMPRKRHLATRFVPRHGQSGRNTTPEYAAWQSMRTRCKQPACNGYERYGGRGIRICERWNTFENFLADMGAKPSAHHSIDRIDSNGHYEPGNCRWATRTEQARNRRSNKIIEAFGRAQCLRAWVDEYGMNFNTVHSRLRRGWAPERALTQSTERA